MRLDLSAFRYLSSEDFRVLISIEMGLRNHEIVPVDLIESIAKLKKISTGRVISSLLKHKLIKHSNVKYDGYSLNYMGYDYLAIHALIRKGILMKIGPKVGVGKESDVFICYVNLENIEKENEMTDEEYNQLKEKISAEVTLTNEQCAEEEIEEESEEKSDEENNESNEPAEPEANPDEIFTQFEPVITYQNTQCHIAVLKLARLGRTSFRAIKNKRNYVTHKTHYNWLYLSRLSALNEFKFMKGLYSKKFAVPQPYGQNRHAILMQYIPSFPLCRIEDLGDKEKAFNELISFIVDLSKHGLVHGDFNEFNILVEMKTEKMYVIDFPQMISIAHADAETYFNRDIQCIKKFFKKKFGISFDSLSLALNEVSVRESFLDIELKAYGYENVTKVEIAQNKKESECECECVEIVNEIEGQNEEIVKEKEEITETNIDEPHGEVIITSNKPQIDKTEIKEKVRNLLKKEQKKQCPKGSNRFKGKKSQAVNLKKLNKD